MVLEATNTRKRAQSHAAADAVPARLSFVSGGRGSLAYPREGD